MMVKLIMGEKGSGKTKQIIEMVNEAVSQEKGSVVCIEKGDKLRFDISYGARLVDVSDYWVEGYHGLLGFLCGIHAGNYDVAKIFIDSLYKIVNDESAEDAEKFLRWLEKFSDEHQVDFVVTISASKDAATEKMKAMMD